MKKIILTVSMLTSIAFAQCNYDKNEVDEFTGDVIKVLKSEVFITHTDSALKKYYRKRDYLTIDTKVASINGSNVIYFHAKILSEKAYKYYGSLRKGSKVIMKLSNGESVTLMFSSSDYGEANYDYGYTTYSNYCLIDERQKESLSRSAVEKVRIYWSEGFESYDCNNSNVYVVQLPCLR